MSNPRRVKVENSSDVNINPSTEEKQDESITQLTTAVGKLTDVVTALGDGSQQTQLVGPTGASCHTTEDINGAAHIGAHIIQHNLVSTLNSSDQVREPGEWFTGGVESSTGAGLICVIFRSDQNCLVCVEQSSDGVVWDTSDKFTYTNYIDNFSTTVHVVGTVFRVRVQNMGAITTAQFRLTTTIQPVGAVLPRALCPHGCLKTTIRTIQDEFGFTVENTPTGEMRTAETSLLAGASFENDTLDQNFWLNQIVADGSVTVDQGSATIATGTVADGSAAIWSKNRGMWLPGYSNRVRIVAQLNVIGSTGNEREWGGVYDTSMPGVGDGYTFVATADGGISVRVYKGSIYTEYTSFNGNLGTTLQQDLVPHSWEIFYAEGRVHFSVDATLLHTVTATEGNLTGTKELFVYASTINSGGATADYQIKAHEAGIVRFGRFSAQHISDFQSGLVAEKVLKVGVGVIESIVISSVEQNASVTLYDGPIAGGEIKFSSGPMSSQTTPFSVALGDIQFNEQLTLAITGGSANTTVIYF